MSTKKGKSKQHKDDYDGKAQTNKGRKIIEKRKGIAIEPTKGVLFLRGRNSSNTNFSLLKFF